MQLKATGTTDKAAPGAPVVAGLMPTAATRLRGMSRVHRDHHTAALLCLVREQGSEVSKRPAMQAPSDGGLAFSLRPLADIGEVFEDQGTPRSNAPGELFRQDVVTVTPKAGLSIPEVM